MEAFDADCNSIRDTSGVDKADVKRIVREEETMYHACIKWLNHEHVLKHVRQHLFIPFFIHNMVERTPATEH